MKKHLQILAAAVVLAILIALAVYWQRVLEINLPPKHVTADPAAALIRSSAYAQEHGGTIISVLGTGSMQPYIPASKNGLNPFDTVVAYVVVGGKYEDVKPGMLCAYRPKWTAGIVLHGSASFTNGGWIMTGLNNENFENWERMTKDNFVGIVTQTFTWNQ